MSNLLCTLKLNMNKKLSKNPEFIKFKDDSGKYVYLEQYDYDNEDGMFVTYFTCPSDEDADYGVIYEDGKYILTVDSDEYPSVKVELSNKNEFERYCEQVDEDYDEDCDYVYDEDEDEDDQYENRSMESLIKNKFMLWGI